MSKPSVTSTRMTHMKTTIFRIFDIGVTVFEILQILRNILNVLKHIFFGASQDDLMLHRKDHNYKKNFPLFLLRGFVNAAAINHFPTDFHVPRFRINRNTVVVPI